MSIERIHLKKILECFGLTAEKRLAAIRADARTEIRKAANPTKGGNDFYSCFWADAKVFASQGGDLLMMARDRIEDGPQRSRLYPLLAEGFLSWWNEKRRWINEPIDVITEGVKAPYSFSEIGGTVKVENLLALRVGGQRTRLIYPYFSEEPALTDENASLGLWLMGQALPHYPIEEMRILDVVRGQTFSVDRSPLSGSEGATFLQRYSSMLSQWRQFMHDFSAASG